ncbi:hypothetical protein ACLQ2Q_04950 [Microbacterium sp. DT81.1]|uniref:hypothetical protein n=1 Tax=Microbacterium sp. DT81.1 TaxID=3393413 RepID=UPI003CF10813
MKRSDRIPPARVRAAAALAAASALALAACATPPAGSGTPAPRTLGSVHPAPPEGEVAAQGTVMDVGGRVELCLGPIAESYPPQCSGIPMDLWSWDNIEGSETSGDVTWGAYAVQGTYDGETISVTQPPVMLALFDPMPFPDPTGGKAGEGDEATAAAIQEELPDLLGADYLSSYPENGYVWVDAVWDDGTLQDAADADYGENTVVIRSALRPLG